jgi:hypothetical protein
MNEAPSHTVFPNPWEVVVHLSLSTALIPFLPIQVVMLMLPSFGNHADLIKPLMAEDSVLGCDNIKVIRDNKIQLD